MISVSNIERFALHDGPGIRTTVFLKGCPLHCPWCANPETWTMAPVLMHDKKKCVGCRHCTQVEPACIWKDGIEIDQKKFKGKDISVKECPAKALSIAGTEMEPEEILGTVLKDRRYYEKSGGGLTISGGEPLLNIGNFLVLANKAKAAGLSVYVETTGNVNANHIQKAETLVDGFLFDVKHTDKEKLKAVTGADLDLVLANLAWLAEACPEKVTVRVPVIPHFNEDVLEEILDLVETLHLKRVHFLPYHSLGKNKWELLHKEYGPGNQPMMDKKDLDWIVKKGKDRGLECQAGG